LNEEQMAKEKLQSIINSPHSSVTSQASTIPPSPSTVAPSNIPAPPSLNIPPPPPLSAGIPPPPPVLAGGIPPPPPPIGIGIPPPPMATVAKQPPAKKIPKPANPLKSFNWSKLPVNKLEGTIWENIDESKIYKMIDLNALDSKFSAYQRQQDSNAIIHASIKKYGSQEDISSGSRKIKELTVIDGRRAQNCTILLSKLKMTNSEMKNALLDCDQSEYLQKDMLEQLIKFIPTKEETDLLNEHKDEIDRMARADRFLYEMSRIFHYEQRLQALFYKKKFHERIGELQPKVEALLKASKEIHGSKKLRKVLEIILALGNYMNKGTRGNAYGFKLQSLSKIIDTKSSADRSVNLMHFLLQILEDKKFADVSSLPEELFNVETAARVNLSELEKEVGQLRIGMRNLKKEIEVMTSRNTSQSGDKFVPVMQEFVTVASLHFSELDDTLQSAKEKFKKVVESFGEDCKKVQPDSFFSYFVDFLESFQVAKKENEAAKKKKLEEEKRKLQEQKAEEKRKRSAKKTGLREAINKEDGNRGEFDDLVSALRSGEIFDKDKHKFQQRRGRAKRPSISAGRERTGSNR